MEKMENKKIWGFVGRFVLIYVAIYSVISIIFLNIQKALPAAGRVGLDFFEPYSMNMSGTLAQVIIGAVIAIVLYPFYDNIVKGERGWLILFAAVWGVVLLGSLHPKPGTIEGMLYTEITFAEHLLVIAAGAVQILLFSWLFLHWERWAIGMRRSDDSIAGEVSKLETQPKQISNKMLKGYVVRYTLLHLLIYMFIGALFYEISGYEEALATMDEFELWRPLENFVMPFVILFGQVLRGGILALLLYPFYNTYMKKQHGWLFLFGLLFGLKVLASVISVPESADLLMQGLQDLTVGIPEITAQTLLFAWLFFLWEKRRNKKTNQNNLPV